MPDPQAIHGGEWVETKRLNENLVEIDSRLDALETGVGTTIPGTVAAEATTRSNADATKQPLRLAVVTIPGASYDVTVADLGKLLISTSDQAVQINLPLGLLAGFHCQIAQLGAGALTPVPANGGFISNVSTYTRTSGASAVARILAVQDNVFLLTGDLQAAAI